MTVPEVYVAPVSAREDTFAVSFAQPIGCHGFTDGVAVEDVDVDETVTEVAIVAVVLELCEVTTEEVDEIVLLVLLTAVLLEPCTEMLEEVDASVLLLLTMEELEVDATTMIYVSECT